MPIFMVPAEEGQVPHAPYIAHPAAPLSIRLHGLVQHSPHGTDAASKLFNVDLPRNTGLREEESVRKLTWKPAQTGRTQPRRKEI